MECEATNILEAPGKTGTELRPRAESQRCHPRPLWPWESGFSSLGLSLCICRNAPPPRCCGGSGSHSTTEAWGLTWLVSNTVVTQEGRLLFLPQLGPRLAHSRCSINTHGKRPAVKRLDGPQRDAGVGVTCQPPSRTLSLPDSIPLMPSKSLPAAPASHRSSRGRRSRNQRLPSAKSPALRRCP